MISDSIEFCTSLHIIVEIERADLHMTRPEEVEKLSAEQQNDKAAGNKVRWSATSLSASSVTTATSSAAAAAG